MTTIWTPWSVFEELADLQDRFNSCFAYAQTDSFAPALTVSGSENEAVIEADLPGIDPTGIDVSVLGNELILRGKREGTRAGENRRVLRNERLCGEFARSVVLPFKADGTGLKAEYRNGVLRVVVPRAESAKPKKIDIVAG